MIHLKRTFLEKMSFLQTNHHLKSIHHRYWFFFFVTYDIRCGPYYQQLSCKTHGIHIQQQFARPQLIRVSLYHSDHVQRRAVNLVTGSVAARLFCFLLRFISNFALFFSHVWNREQYNNTVMFSPRCMSQPI